MSQIMIIIIAGSIGITSIIYLMRYLITKVFDKGADAVSNAYKRSKNAQEGDNMSNLSDRYIK